MKEEKKFSNPILTGKWANFKYIPEGHCADTRAGKFQLVSIGGRAECLGVQTRERGAPSALAKIQFIFVSLTHKWKCTSRHIKPFFSTSFRCPHLSRTLTQLGKYCYLILSKQQTRFAWIKVISNFHYCLCNHTHQVWIMCTIEHSTVLLYCVLGRHQNVG